MANINRTEIPLNKTKIALLLLGAIAFTALGLWFLLLQKNVLIYRVSGVIVVLVFGFAASILARQLQDNTPGLIIDETGISDNSSAVAAGQILWRDIKDVFVVEEGGHKFIMLEVRNPEKYIERQTHYLQKKAMQYNLKTYGSPLSITTDGLKYPFEKLYALIKANFEQQTV
ncbi:hypothetical protein BDD43_5116 [Mucilaginibacter gracilis]|uniref:PH (Pleckstrin Homology) domain-containing protein n=1 Tax=Mucilaginibacter gracilis TaxID=423350 RepID=A0A495J7Y5_9SPHI|nr:STM3941 family protein [Mucilaginibacter gracilis]RKR84863.1 hypothetical protein BDD43_5116 [Mucilaginibacter gracilis]